MIMAWETREKQVKKTKRDFVMVQTSMKLSCNSHLLSSRAHVFSFARQKLNLYAAQSPLLF